MAKNKFYGVKKGYICGIFDNWDDTQKQIKGFPGAEFHGFPTRQEAEDFMNGVIAKKEIGIVNDGGYSYNQISNIPDSDKVYIYVDGSFMDEKIGCGMLFVKNDEIFFRDAIRYPGSDVSQRNIAGEIYATIRAIQSTVANDFKNIVIAYDYEGIEKWINGEWEAKTSLSKRYVEYFKEYIIKRKVNFGFLNIMSHTGEKYNEEVDGLAKLGTTL